MKSLIVAGLFIFSVFWLAQEIVQIKSTPAHSLGPQKQNSTHAQALN